MNNTIVNKQSFK